MYKQSTRVDTRPRGVAVNMSPCHGEDRQFKSDRGRHFFLQKIMPRQLSWQSNGLKIRVSTVRFCPEAPCTCGNSSAVEHRLAKAGVASSNLVSRSTNVPRQLSRQSNRLLTDRSQVRVLLGEPISYHGPLVKRLRHRPFTAVSRVRFPDGSPHGRLAQLGERLPYKQDVGSSILSSSTRPRSKHKACFFFLYM